MDEDRRAGDNRQRVKRVLDSQVHEPEEATGRHALDWTAGHSTQGEKPFKEINLLAFLIQKGLLQAVRFKSKVFSIRKSFLALS